MTFLAAITFDPAIRGVLVVMVGVVFIGRFFLVVLHIHAHTAVHHGGGVSNLGRDDDFACFFKVQSHVNLIANGQILGGDDAHDMQAARLELGHAARSEGDTAVFDWAHPHHPIPSIVAFV